MEGLFTFFIVSWIYELLYIFIFFCSHGDNRSGSDLNHLADLEGDTVTFYGAQSLEALDRNWGMQAAAAVTHIIFKFIDFEDIAKHLYKVRTKFPGVQVGETVIGKG